MSPKKTPLYEKHQELGGNFVDYAGFALPVEYEGLVPEHTAVRENVGLFDVSHMGEFLVEGKEAVNFVNYVCTNDYRTSEDKQIKYSMLLNEKGGIIDDLLVYKINDETFLMIPNAANTKKDYDHIVQFVDKFDCTLKNLSDETAEIAIQGPKAEALLQKVVNVDLKSIKYYYFDFDEIDGKKILISRTGYTGEDGFEVYGDGETIRKIVDDLFKYGDEFGLKPCGLGCRDTLRFEAAMPLYGNEMTDDISPLEAGLKFAVKPEKEFIGREAFLKMQEEGIPRKIVGLQMEKRKIARQHYEVQKDGERVGEITTGYLSPTLGVCLANALVDRDKVKLGDTVDVMIRNKPNKATVIKKKFLESVKK